MPVPSFNFAKRRVNRKFNIILPSTFVFFFPSLSLCSKRKVWRKNRSSHGVSSILKWFNHIIDGSTTAEWHRQQRRRWKKKLSTFQNMPENVEEELDIHVYIMNFKLAFFDDMVCCGKTKNIRNMIACDRVSFGRWFSDSDKIVLQNVLLHYQNISIIHPRRCV